MQWSAKRVELARQAVKEIAIALQSNEGHRATHATVQCLK